jgi:hypothetical protein
MTTTPPRKLWVLLKSHDSAVVNHPTQVPTKDCENVDDFIDAIKKKLSPKLDAITVDNITLHLTEDSTALERDEPLPYQNTKQTALVVTVPPPATPSSAGPLLKSHRQKSFRKMAVAASCRSFLDAVAKELKVLYRFDCIHKGPTVGDVLRAKRGVEGEEWSIEVVQKTHNKVDDDGFTITVKRGTPLTSVRLPDFFTDDEWTKLSKFNEMTTRLIHVGALPTLRTGTPYIILPHADYTEEMVDFLKTIGVKASLFPDKSWLEVKDEDALSEGSSLI